jgi:hypothetical protein
MSFSVAIVGLPNVGKSTLFNALLQKQAALAANYPFATIEPNVGVVPVPDNNLIKLAEIVNTNRIIPSTVEFVDIAGLVKGASTGAGLGNKFLANVRETSIIAHVIRLFNDDNIIKEGSVDPVEDYQTIELELQLADLATLEKQTEPKGKKMPLEILRWQIIERWRTALNNGYSLRKVIDTDEELTLAKELSLLTAKAEIVVANVGDVDLTQAQEIKKNLAAQLNISPDKIIIISAKLEEELSSLSSNEKIEFLAEYGQSDVGLDAFIKLAYRTLKLQSFYTAGEKEVKAWTISVGTTAQQAAGVIHTDFAKHFINAQVVDLNDFLSYKGWKTTKENGKVRQEGRDYQMQENDVVEFMVGK